MAIVPDLRCGYIYQDQSIIVLKAHTGALLVIQCRPYIGYINIKLFTDGAALLQSGIRKLDPAANIIICDLTDDAVVCPVNIDHKTHYTLIY